MSPSRSLTPLLGETVLPDPWVTAVTERDEGGRERLVLYLVGTANEPMLERRRREAFPAWDDLPPAERERRRQDEPSRLCDVYRSRDLGRTWEETGHCLFGALGTLGYGRVEIWAPEIHRLEVPNPGDGTTAIFVGLYTTRRDGRPEDAERTIPIAPKWLGKFDFSRHLVIGQMVGPSVTGPFALAPEPLVDSFFSVLDGHLFQHPVTGACRLFWKEDQTAHDLPAEMWMQAVDVTAAGLVRRGTPIRILTADPGCWHGVTVEGMAAFHDDALPPNWIYLLFSGNECFNDLYGTGCLKLDLETGATELHDKPVLDKGTDFLRGRLVGIGHPSIVALPAGEAITIDRPGAAPIVVRHLMFAHAWRADDVHGVETDRRRPYVFGLVVEKGWPRIIELP